MSSESEDTSTIDEKKNKKTFQTDIKGFIISFIKLIIGILFFFTFAAINLYLSKLAESNILPTDINCYPYTNNKIKIEELSEGSNIFYHGNKSMKIKFDPSKINNFDPLSNANKNKNEKYVLLDLLRNNKSPKQHFLTNYLISILEHLFQFNYSAFNIYFNSLNSLPEILLLFISNFLTIFYCLILAIINIFYFLFIWFYCMDEFFKKPSTNDSSSSFTQKSQSFVKNISLLENPFEYSIAICFVILFTIILFFAISISPLLNFTIMFSCILSMCSYRAYYLESTSIGKKQKEIGILDVIKDTFGYYKTTVTTIFSLFFISNTFTYLGNTIGLVIAIVTIISYLGYFSVSFFKPIEEINNNLSKVNYDFQQASKTCILNNETTQKINSLTSYIIDTLSSFSSFFKTPNTSSKKGGGYIPELNKNFLKTINEYGL